jgi:hypothetical protein
MRKTLFLVMTLAMFVAQIIASPVDVNRAQQLGLKFMQSNASKQVSTLSLAHTQMTESGMAALYVFNTDGGYVIVSADDVAQPILAFSDEGEFDANNLPEGLAYYLRHYARQIGYAVENHLAADPEIAAQWAHVAMDGNVADPVRGMSDVQPLISTTWNQDYPYNYYCPTASGGPGGRAYAGCVACAMSMVMKYWNWPTQGNGQHSYTPDGFPTQSVNFGNTTYNWANMPNSLSNGSPSAQIQAVATLMYHCGVSVDMQYAYNGSGAFTEHVPGAIANYFRYTDHATLYSRDSFTKNDWEELLIAGLEEGFPFYYAGSEGDAGHAFVCCGVRYSDRKFYFNYGWGSGYWGGNGWYAIDALNTLNGSFNDNQRVIADFIPDYVYNALIPAAKDLTVTSTNAHSKTGIVRWTNPTENLGEQEIENIDKVVLLRNGVEIFSQLNVTPGTEMTYQDEVPDYDCYTYTVYYLSDGIKGRFAKTSYLYGPSCTWKIIGQTSNFHGWNGGKIQLLSNNGTVVDEITMESSVPVSLPIRVPEGNVTFKWLAPMGTVSSLSINIKNSANTSVYSYSGSSNNLPAVLTTTNNDCDGCQPPTELSGEYKWSDEGFGTLLTWVYDGEPQSFKVYRSNDGVEYSEIATVNKLDREYFDPAGAGVYYYKVTAYRSYCESIPAWTSDDQDYVSVEVTSVNEDNSACCQVYPNPANTMVCVEAEDLEQVTICNVMGQVVYQQRCSENGVVISTSSLPAGIYNLCIKTAQATTTKRFSVVH